MERVFYVLSKDLNNPLPFGAPLWKFLTFTAAEAQAKQWAKDYPAEQFMVVQPILDVWAEVPVSTRKVD